MNNEAVKEEVMPAHRDRLLASSHTFYPTLGGNEDKFLALLVQRVDLPTTDDQGVGSIEIVETVSRDARKAVIAMKNAGTFSARIAFTSGDDEGERYECEFLSASNAKFDWAKQEEVVTIAVALKFTCAKGIKP